MTRGELELVEGLGDPLTLGDLLPRGSVARGDSWKLPASAVVALSGYDVLKSSTLEATLDGLDPTTARLHVKGQVQGEVLGGTGTIVLDGRASFDRKAGIVNRLELERTESRQAGPVEAGLDVKSTLTVIRRLAPLRPSWPIPRLPASRSTLRPRGSFFSLSRRRGSTTCCTIEAGTRTGTIPSWLS